MISQVLENGEVVILELVAVIFNNPFKVRREFFDQKEITVVIFEKYLSLIRLLESRGVGEFNAKRQLVELGCKFLQFTVTKQSSASTTALSSSPALLTQLSISTLQDEDPTAFNETDMITEKLDLRVVADYIYNSMEEFELHYSKL